MSLTVSGDFGPAERTLDRLIRAAEDPAPALDGMAEDFAAAERQRFNAAPWSLRQATIERKARQWGGAPAMVRTGRLRASLTNRPFPIERLAGDTIQIGTDVPYAAFHRTVLPDTTAMREAWERRMREYLEKAATG